MPMTVISDLGQGQAHPAVALGLDDHDRAGLGDREVRARDGDPRAEELLAQVEAGGLGERRADRRSGRPAPADRRRPISSMKMSRISVRLRWIAGTRMCDGRSCPSWTIISARSVSQTSMPSWRERLVELDLLGRHRLDLDDLVGAVRRGRCAATIAFASAASRAQWTTPPAAVTAASSCSSSAGRSREDLVLDGRAGQAQRLPVGALGDGCGALRRGSSSSRGRGSPGAARPPGRPGPPPGTAACRRSVGSGRSRDLRSDRRLAVMAPAVPSSGQDLGEVHHPDRRAPRATAGRRCASGTTCRRRSGPRRPEPSTSSTLSRPIATDVSAFLTAKVPPNPQHGLGSGQVDEGQARRPRRAAACGRSPTPSRRVEWQVGWNATVCGKRAPTSVTPEDVDQELGQLEDPRRDRGDPRRQGAVVRRALPPATVGWWWRTIAAHDPDGVTTTS